MKLEKLMTYHADLKAPQPVGEGPFGNRMVVEVTGGWFEGPKLKGTFLTCGGDWLLAHPDGYGRLDVRGTLQTEDGAHIYMQYNGVLQLTDGVMAVLGGGDTPTQYGDQNFFTAPRFETGDARYQWINQIQCVSEGRVVPGPGVEYHVYQCVND